MDRRDEVRSGRLSRNRIPLEQVILELDHLGRAMGLEDMPRRDQRAEVALLAMRSGLVGADEGG